MDGVKAFFTRQIGPFPVYAYVVVGVLAIVGGVIFFGNKNTGKATAAPQTNTNPDGLPLPYPAAPGAGAAGIPPSAAFDTSGTMVPQYTSQSNFMPAPPEPTPSQAWAAPAAPPPNVVEPYLQPLTVRLFEPIAPLLGNLLPGILTPNPPSVPPPYVPARTHPNSGALA